MSTISDVARKAGVSTMTVSRVLNNSGYASNEARARVLAAARELGYMPDARARGLRVGRTSTLALILTDITNPFFTTVARGVEDAASAQGFSVIFCNTDESEQEEARYTRMLLERQVDGLLLVPAGSSAGAIEAALARGKSVVLLDRVVGAPAVDTVRCDSEGGARRATRHLLALGHRHIAVLGGSPAVSVARERVAGARLAFAEAGLEFREAYVLHGRPDVASGAEMTRQAFSLSPRPTALLATNNFIAVGAFSALREAGLAVPADMSLAGFDDLPASLVLDPFLTVVSQPAYEMGRRGTELLLARLRGEGPAEPQDICLPTELVVRRSTAAPRSFDQTL
jgi:LacI family transcriptional regulator